MSQNIGLHLQQVIRMEEEEINVSSGAGAWHCSALRSKALAAGPLV